MLLSTDNGGTWANDPPPTGVTSIGAVNCASPANCVFVGYEGTSPILGQTSNSGSGSGSISSAGSLTDSAAS
jgi:hypothetical protein